MEQVQEVTVSPSSSTSRWLLGLSALVLLTGCVVRGRTLVTVPVPVGVVVAHREPPPVRWERIPPPPSVDHVWIPGHWVWDRGDYVWVPGHHEVRPHRRAVWEEGHWTRHERGWTWVEGRWR